MAGAVKPICYPYLIVRMDIRSVCLIDQVVTCWKQSAKRVATGVVVSNEIVYKISESVLDPLDWTTCCSVN